MARKTPAVTKRELKKISRLMTRVRDADEMAALLTELFTPTELHDLFLRLRLLDLLLDGASQRKIAATLRISLCKITRGSRILKNPRAVVPRLLEENETHEPSQS